AAERAMSRPRTKARTALLCTVRRLATSSVGFGPFVAKTMGAGPGQCPNAGMHKCNNAITGVSYSSCIPAFLYFCIPAFLHFCVLALILLLLQYPTRSDTCPERPFRRRCGAAGRRC